MNEPSSSPARSGDGGKTAEVKEKAGEVAAKAGDVGAEAGAQVKAVAREATDHVRGLLDRARSDVQEQARSKSGQAAGGLRTLSSQLSALASGNPDSAGPLVDYLYDADNRISRLAGRLDQGPDAIMSDVRSFARRRPMVFLGAAGVLGFAVGRLLRSGAQASSSEPSGGFSGGYVPPQDAMMPPVVATDPLAPPVVVPGSPPVTVSPAGVVEP